MQVSTTSEHTAEPPAKRIRLSPPPPSVAAVPLPAATTTVEPDSLSAPPVETSNAEDPFLVTQRTTGAEVAASSPLSAIDSDVELSTRAEQDQIELSVGIKATDEQQALSDGTAVDAVEANDGAHPEQLSPPNGTTGNPPQAPAVETVKPGNPVPAASNAMAAAESPRAETLGILSPAPLPPVSLSTATSAVSLPIPASAPAEEGTVATAASPLENALVVDAPASASEAPQADEAPPANKVADSVPEATAPVQRVPPPTASTASSVPTSTESGPSLPPPQPTSTFSEPSASNVQQAKALPPAVTTEASAAPPASGPIAAAPTAPNPKTSADAAKPASSAAIPAPTPALAPAPEPERDPEPEDPFTFPHSEAYRAVRAASQWNSLLGWARSVRLESSPGGAERGWDFATGMYHVPRNSPAYTANVPRATPESLALSSSKKPLPALSLHATSSSLLYSQNPDVANLSDDDGPGTGGVATPSESLFTESGRPRRSRAAMTRG